MSLYKLNNKRTKIIFLLFLSLNVFAQRTTTCTQLSNKDSKARINIQNTLNIAPDTNLILRVPVVFHVYHHGEPYGFQNNFHEDTLKKAIFKLNELFRAKNKYNETIDTRIEFYLLTDSVNCVSSQIPSNGIKRSNIYNLVSPFLNQTYIQYGITPSTYTFFEKELVQMSPNPIAKRCLNIRLIPNFRELAGIVSSGNLENVVLLSGILQGAASGRIGGFAHELGHVFGLSHTFFGSEYDTTCQDGDLLSDTEPHNGSDVFYPDEINTCTGQRKGKVIYNIMSYGVDRNNYTKMQRDKMREILYTYYPEFAQTGNQTFISALTKGSPTSACNFTADQVSASFNNGFSFNLGSIQVSNPFEKSLPHTDYACSVKTELIQGNAYSFNYSDQNVSSTYFKIYADYNNDGDFNDVNEEIASGQRNGSSIVQGNFTVPTNPTLNNWLRLRLVRTSSSTFTSCNTPGFGSAIDFGVKILSTCTKPASPQIQNQIVSNGQSAILSATGCTSQTNWYSGGELITVGNTVNTAALSTDKYYQVTCAVGICESLITNARVEVQQSITIGTLNASSYCINSNINVPIFSTLSSGSFYTISLKKGNVVINTKIVQSLSNNQILIPIQYTTYMGGNLIPLSNSNDFTIQLESQNLLTNQKWVSSAVPISVGVISPNSHKIVENPNQIFDINSNNSSDQICPGKSKVFYAQVVNFFGKSLETVGLTFTWKKDGSMLGTTTSNSIVVSQPGLYTFTVNQGSCVGNSSSFYLSSSSYIANNVKVIGNPYACESTPIELYSDYQSTTASYQWQRNGINIPGAVLSSYVTQESARYNIIVQEPTCNLFQGKDQNLNFLKGLALNVQSVNNDSTLCVFSAFGLSSSNTIRLEDTFGGGLAINNSITYQWQKNGLDLPSEQKNYLDIYYKSSNNTGVGTYKLVKKQGNCTSVSKSFTISESSIFPKPQLLHNPTTSVCAGTLVLYASQLTPGIWLKDNVVLPNNSYILHTNSSGNYKFVVGEGTTCRNESDPVSLNIGGTVLPKIIYYDSNKQNLCGSNDYLNLTYEIQDNTGNSFQWLKDGIEIPTNFSQPTLLTVTSPGTYSLRITNGSCVGLSNEILVANTTSDISIKAKYSDLACTNRSTQIELTGASNNNNYETITWKRNGQTIPEFIAKSLYTETEGAYTVEYNNGSGCMVTTNTINLTKGGGSVVVPAVTVAKGQSATLSATGCNGSVLWYETPQISSISHTGSVINSPGLDLSKSYYVTCNYNGCENLVATVAQITVTGCLQNQIFSGLNPPNGIFRAVNKISSTATPSNQTIYSSGKSIDLLPGFKVDNKVFEASIGGCTE